MKDFNIIVTPSTEIVKKTISFKCEIEQEKAFYLLKYKLILALLLVLHNFIKTFEIECDASEIGIEKVLKIYHQVVDLYHYI